MKFYNLLSALILLTFFVSSCSSDSDIESSQNKMAGMKFSYKDSHSEDFTYNFDGNEYYSLQNALKYGDGRNWEKSFDEKDTLITDHQTGNRQLTLSYVSGTKATLNDKRTIIADQKMVKKCHAHVKFLANLRYDTDVYSLSVTEDLFDFTNKQTGAHLTLQLNGNREYDIVFYSDWYGTATTNTYTDENETNFTYQLDSETERITLTGEKGNNAYGYMSGSNKFTLYYNDDVYQMTKTE